MDLAGQAISRSGFPWAESQQVVACRTIVFVNASIFATGCRKNDNPAKQPADYQHNHSASGEDCCHDTLHQCSFQSCDFLSSSGCCRVNCWCLCQWWPDEIHNDKCVACVLLSQHFQADRVFQAGLKIYQSLQQCFHTGFVVGRVRQVLHFHGIRLQVI